jgi:hypothetical protein
MTNVDDRKYAQLSSRFITQRLVNIIQNCIWTMPMMMMPWSATRAPARLKLLLRSRYRKKN